MITNSVIPVLHASKPKDLPVKMLVINGKIELITASVDNVPITFVKDSNGWFKSETIDAVDTSYLSNIEAQLNRMFTWSVMRNLYATRACK